MNRWVCRVFDHKWAVCLDGHRVVRCCVRCGKGTRA